MGVHPVIRNAAIENALRRKQLENARRMQERLRILRSERVELVDDGGDVVQWEEERRILVENHEEIKREYQARLVVEADRNAQLARLCAELLEACVVHGTPDLDLSAYYKRLFLLGGNDG